MQLANVVRYNYLAIFYFIILDSAAYVLIKILNYDDAIIPVVPVTILGGGLAIFLGFRNNAAYDRWWEARKIWGAIVNTSRSFGTKILTFMNMDHVKEGGTVDDLNDLHKRMIHRHIAYINTLRLALRGKDHWKEVEHHLSDEEFRGMMSAPNKATYLNHCQGRDLQYAFGMGYIEDFRHMSLMNEVKEIYDHQGKSERINKTVFPFYYTYFTEVFLWLFIILLPFSLADQLKYLSVPISVAISFVFYILDKSGKITEDPFENRAADIPLTAICNTIERDLKFMLDESDVPEVIKPRYTKFKVEYFK